MTDQKERHQHSITLAQRFYDDHRTLFDEASLTNSLDEMWFDMALADFDRWLVTQEVLAEPADAFDSNSVQRYGVVQHRNGARGRINAAARKATNHPAYSIGSRASGEIRIKLVELYARDAPADIAGGVQTTMAHFHRAVGRITRLANTSGAVSDVTRQQVNLCASVMEPLLSAFTWAGLNMKNEILRQHEGRALGLQPVRGRRRIKS